MTDYTKVDGVKVHEAALTPNQEKAFANAKTIADAITAKLAKLNITAQSKVLMIDSKEYCFFQTTFLTQTKSEKHETDIAYSEDRYAAPNTKEELLALAKSILHDTIVAMGIDPDVLNA